MKTGNIIFLRLLMFVLGFTIGTIAGEISGRGAVRQEAIKNNAAHYTLQVRNNGSSYVVFNWGPNPQNKK
jgi:hypothetical protein